MVEGLLYHRTPEIDELRSDWRTLCVSVSEPAFFHRPEWYGAVQGHLCDDIVYHCFFDGGELVAVFPLRLCGPTRGEPRRLELPAHRDIFLADALIHDRYRDRAWSRLLLGRLSGGVEHPHTVRFHRVSSHSCVSKAFAGRGARFRRTYAGGTTYCDCTDAAALDRLSAKNLRNVDRLHRRAVREIGDVEHESFVGKEAVERGFDALLGVEAAGWKGPDGTGTSMACVPESEAFFRAVTVAFAARDEARVDVLSIGGVTAAAQLAVRTGETWSLLKIGFDPSLTRLGPGAILLKLFLEEMAADASVTYVSLVTAPSWAERWHMETEAVYDVVLFARTPMGVVLSLAHDASSLARVVGKKAAAWSRR